MDQHVVGVQTADLLKVLLKTETVELLETELHPLIPQGREPIDTADIFDSHLTECEQADRRAAGNT